MNLDALAVIALLIIVPMSLILSNYSTYQIKTLQYQIDYDTKLKNSTYDAIKAFQLNMSNSTTSDIINSKMRDIEASANVFYSSLANNFNSNGYTSETLKNYVPALVYTLYDGYYIYSAYDNKISIELNNDSTYTAGERIYGLKPYIYYSCRYKPNLSSDFVITYSLDSYITIQGIINNEVVDKSGYLLTGVTKTDEDKYYYRGLEIVQESGNNLKENVYIEDANDYKDAAGNTIHVEGESKYFPHKKNSGTKYYYDNVNDTVFSMMNDDKNNTKQNVNIDEILNNNQGIEFYKEAYEFTTFVKNKLGDLSSNDAVDIEGNEYVSNGPYTQNIKIFDELNSSDKYIEDKDSDFYLHRTEVIKNAIESNLIVAIDNYNNVSSSGVQFAMPKLNDSDWENITTGISMITFLQGLSIGGRIYNGYSIVENNVNDDFVSENSIYIVVGDTYYRPTDETLLNNSIDIYNGIGVLNSNFEVRNIIDTLENNNKKNVYYYPRQEKGAYTSVIQPGASTNLSGKSVDDYMKEYADSNEANKERIAQIYYTGLGRERKGLFRVNSNHEETNISYSQGGLTTIVDGANHIVNGDRKNGADFEDNHIKFDGVDDRVDCGIIKNDTQTLEVTFSTDEIRKQHIIGNWERGGGGIYIDSSGQICATTMITDVAGTPSTSEYTYLYSGVTIVPGKIYNVSLTYELGTLKLYVNGDEKFSKPTLNLAIRAPYNDTEMALGVNPTAGSGYDGFEEPGACLKGNVYSARIYNRALSSSEIQNNFNVDKNLYNIEN